MKQLTIILLVLFFFGGYLQISASEKVPVKPKKKNALKLTHKKGKKEALYVMKDQKIKFWYEGKKHKGRLDSISETEIFVKGKPYNISKISKIKAKMSNGKGMFIAGSIVGGIGISAIIGGITMFVVSKSKYEYDALAYAIMGLLFLIIGVILLPIGIVLFVIGRNKMKSATSWKIEAVDMQNIKQ